MPGLPFCPRRHSCSALFLNKHWGFQWSQEVRVRAKAQTTTCVLRVRFSAWYKDADTIRQSDFDASCRRRDSVTVRGSTWVIDWGRRHARSCHGPFCHTNWQEGLAAQWTSRSRRGFCGGRTPLRSPSTLTTAQLLSPHVKRRDRHALPDTELAHGQLGICVSPQPLLPLTPLDTINGSPHDTPSTEFG